MVPIQWENRLVILYEYPFNERLRTYLRLEQLFCRLVELIDRETPTDHHFAIATMFEIVDVASRSDLKADVMRELERQKSTFEQWQNNPDIDHQRLMHMISQIEQRYQALHAQSGKTGQGLTDNELLSAVRSRLDIPGGLNCFDVPSYHFWLSLPHKHRQYDLGRWCQSLKPLADSVFLLLGVLRDTGTPQTVVAKRGSFQQSLPANRSYQLLRLRIDSSLGLVPEISGNRLMVSLRLHQIREGGLMQAYKEDATLELSLCL